MTDTTDWLRSRRERLMRQVYAIDAELLRRQIERDRMTANTTLQPHEQRVVDEKAELDGRIEKLRAFIADSPVYKSLPEEDRILLAEQYGAMMAYSQILGRRIARFTQPTTENKDDSNWPVINGVTHVNMTAAEAQHFQDATQDHMRELLGQSPAEDSAGDDFPLGKACDLSGEGNCEACQ